MIITTNNRARQLISFNDLPVHAQSDFDYLDEDAKFDYRIVEYKEHFYDVFDAMRLDVSPDNPMSRFDACAPDSYFSGVLFKLVSNHGEYDVICATYIS